MSPTLPHREMGWAHQASPPFSFIILNINPKRCDSWLFFLTLFLFEFDILRTLGHCSSPQLITNRVKEEGILMISSYHKLEFWFLLLKEEWEVHRRRSSCKTCCCMLRARRWVAWCCSRDSDTSILIAKLPKRFLSTRKRLQSVSVAPLFRLTLTRFIRCSVLCVPTFYISTFSLHTP